jgi:hypothetical protein
VVRDADYLQTIGPQDGITLSITGRPLRYGVNPAIEFDCQPEFGAEEVYNEAMYRMLAPELETQAPAITQYLPSDALCSGLSLTQFTRPANPVLWTMV